MASYKPLQSIVLTATTGSVIFSNIDQSYTDLVIVARYLGDTVDQNMAMRVGSTAIDTGSNYSQTFHYGNGSTTPSARYSSNSQINISYGGGLTGPTLSTIHLMNYSNTTTYKTVLVRSGTVGGTYNESMHSVAMWRGSSGSSTEAITSINLYATLGNNFYSGATFDLYGIKSGAPQALGGDIVVTDGTYWYHAFKTTQTFTPLKPLAIDYLVVAGGGSGGEGYSTRTGGGGAGGLRSTVTATGGGGSLESPITVSAGQPYVMTVGAGASGGNGSDSSIAGSGVTTITSLGGGNGTQSSPTASSGGSGGGAGWAYSGPGIGGAGTTGQGYAGGNSTNGSPYPAGGGGGAGAVGFAASGSNGGSGGAGVSISAFASATGTGVSNYYAGGGGGGGAGSAGGAGGGGAGLNSAGTGGAGVANTGGGGGGQLGEGTSARGGSGIIIVRYPV